MDTETPANECLHEVYLRAGKSRFYFRNPDRGVSLSDERIGWTSDGQSDGAPLANIVEVHLEPAATGATPSASAKSPSPTVIGSP